MKKTAIVAFTEQGNELGSRLQILLREQGICDRYCFDKDKYEHMAAGANDSAVEAWSDGIADKLSESVSVGLKDSEPNTGFVCFFSSGKQLMQKIFYEYDQFVMIAACGIVVRLLDGLLRGKMLDPAVVVMDVQGRFAIPLLSGHWGGANALAGEISALTGAIPVITTATDSCGCFSTDLFAKANHLTLTDPKEAKRAAAAILEGKKIAVVSELPVVHAPEGVKVAVLPETGRMSPEKKTTKETTKEILTASKDTMQSAVVNGVQKELERLASESAVLLLIGTKKVDQIYDDVKIQQENDVKLLSVKKAQLPRIIVRMVPQDIVLGVGCRRNISPEVFKTEVLRCMEKYGLDLRRVRALHSISIKQDEIAIRELVKEYRWESRFFSAEELLQAEGEFSMSEFVQEVTGVDNVCERSAVMTGGSLIVRKTVGEGMTLAAARLAMTIDFVEVSM